MITVRIDFEFEGWFETYPEVPRRGDVVILRHPRTSERVAAVVKSVVWQPGSAPPLLRVVRKGNE